VNGLMAAGRRPWALLGLIVLLAGAVRMAGLQDCPNGLFRDEAEKGYNAWSLATHGGAVDLDPGRPPRFHRLPWMISVMGNRTSAIYQYASIPFMWLGGLQVWTTRMASATAGTLTVMLAGWLLMRAWGRWEGLAAALWLALCPWHLVFSRWALEGIFVPLLMVTVLWGLWGVEQGRRWGGPLAGAGLGWLFYAYSGAQPLVLAWGLCLASLYGRRIQPRRWPFWLGLALFLLPVIPTLIVRLEPGGSSRLARVALWADPELTPIGLLTRFIIQYIEHFAPRFLFWNGDAQPRHAIPGMGQLLWIDAVLVPAGLYGLIRGRMPLRGAILCALACGPLPAAITREGIPHALRAIGMAAPLAVLGGLGLARSLRFVARQSMHRGLGVRRARLWQAVLGLALTAFALAGWARYMRVYREAPLARVAFESGHRQAWETFLLRRQPGQRLLINGRIPYAPYFEWFFTRVDSISLTRGAWPTPDIKYCDPQVMISETLSHALRPGDWRMEPLHPQWLQGPDGRPWLSGEQARRVGEAWVALNQSSIPLTR
jgi:4-amino-4-deoxy-L-arabinose transferase-like glycosyltransferase